MRMVRPSNAGRINNLLCMLALDDNPLKTEQVD